MHIFEVEQWDSSAVANWIASIGYQQYSKHFKDNEITGDVLINASHDMLKDLNIKSVGHRLAILRAIKQLLHSIGFSAGADGINTTANSPNPAVLSHSTTKKSLNRTDSHSSLVKLFGFTEASDGSQVDDAVIIPYQNQLTAMQVRIQRLEEQSTVKDNQIAELQTKYLVIRGEFDALKTLVANSTQQQQPTSASQSNDHSDSNTSNNSSPSLSKLLLPKRSKAAKPTASPTKKSSSLATPPQHQQNLLSIKSTTTENVKIQPPSPSPTPDDKDRFFPAGEGGTHIRVYGAKLNNQEYAEYKSVAVAPQDTCFALLPSILRKWKIKEDPKHYALYISINGQEKCLSHQEHPVLLIQQYRNANLMFILKSIRKTESVVLSSSHRSSAVIPTLNRNSRATSEYRQSTLAGTPSVLSPQSDSATTVSPTPPAATSHAAAAAASDNNNNNSSSKAINVINGDGSDAAEDLESYGTAVAIYEYRAQRDDEFNVSIGDHFTVRDKAEVNWWVVEKDGVTGWVPAGCLMDESTDNANQNNVISGGDGVHINGNVGSVNGSGDGAANDGKPVTAVALYDYDAAGPNEVSIKRQDVLTIHKIYQHWLLVETVDGQTGWAPSCYVSINPTAAMSNTAAVEDTANTTDLRNGSTNNTVINDGQSNSNSLSRPGSPSKTYADVVKKVKDLANGGEEPSIVRSENVNFRELSFALSSTTNNSDIMERSKRNTLLSDDGKTGNSKFNSIATEKLRLIASHQQSPSSSTSESSALSAAPVVAAEDSHNDDYNENSSSNPNSSALKAASKLDTLMTMFNPYLNEGGYANKSRSRSSSVSSGSNVVTEQPNSKENRVVSVVQEIISNLYQQQTSAGDPTADRQQLQTAEKNAKNLMGIFGALKVNSTQYESLLSKLEAIAEQSTPVRETGNGNDNDIFAVQRQSVNSSGRKSRLTDTCDALNDLLESLVSVPSSSAGSTLIIGGNYSIRNSAQQTQQQQQRHTSSTLSFPQQQQERQQEHKQQPNRQTRNLSAALAALDNARQQLADDEEYAAAPSTDTGLSTTKSTRQMPSTTATEKPVTVGSALSNDNNQLNSISSPPKNKTR